MLTKMNDIRILKLKMVARFCQELEVDEITVAIWKNVFEAYELIQQQILDLCSEKYHPAESE